MLKIIYKHNSRNTQLSMFFLSNIKFLTSRERELVENISIDVSITNVGLILTKLRWFQLFSTQVKIQFRPFFEKKINFLGFHVVVLMKTFPLMYQLLM